MLFIFHLNTYNDIDHMTPIIWKFLLKGQSVLAIFLSGYHFESDYRISFLLNYPGFQVIRASKFQYFRKKIIFNKYVLKYFGIPSDKKKLSRLLAFVWPNKFLKKQVAALVYEWGNSGRLNHYDAIARNIPTIVLPHGFNIFLNFDVNQQLKEKKRKTGNWPDFSNRNIFDMYVLQTERHRKLSIDWGQNPEKTQAWGSARFSPQWSKKNLELCGQFIASQDDYNKLKVVFFLPHWSYNVKEKETLSLLKTISDLPNVYMTIKGHTRGTGSLSRNWAEKLGEKMNVEVNSRAHSSSLIAWSDVVINFGSSIAIDALNQNKPIIHTPFLHRNQTIFDNGEVNYITNSIEDVVLLLEKGCNDDLNPAYGDKKTKFLSHEVYASKKTFDVLEFYYNQIIRIANNNYNST